MDDARGLRRLANIASASARPALPTEQRWHASCKAMKDFTLAVRSTFVSELTPANKFQGDRGIIPRVRECDQLPWS